MMQVDDAYRFKMRGMHYIDAAEQSAFYKISTVSWLKIYMFIAVWKTSN